MQRNFLLAALPLLALPIIGCDDLGKCDDPNEGRTLALTDSGRVMYAGQAVLIAACSTGCHSSTSTGDARVGAPAGLDFDIVPLDAEDEDALSGLQKRQRRVFDNREGIWDQVVDGLMPPDDVGAGFRTISPGTFLKYKSDGSCPGRGDPGVEAVAPIKDKAGREVLRQWLACGAPIVELNSKEITKPEPGTVGDQYPACAAGETPLDPTFDNVYEIFTARSCSIAGCHGGSAPAAALDLSSLDVAFDELLTAGGSGVPQVCDLSGDPLVTPGDPGASFLYAKLEAGIDVSKRDSLCGSTGYMPPGLPVTEEQLDLVKRWIEAGAPAPGEAAGGADAGM